MSRYSLEKKDQIESILINLYISILMDIPDNHEDIVQYCYEDVCETADADNWSYGDVIIAFRRFLQTK